MTSEDFLRHRFAALASGDYVTLYATYHEESPFLQQFSDCGAYVGFAEENLRAINVENWMLLDKRSVADNRLEQLLVMELAVDGGSQYFYELALLIETSDGWRYHSAQKLGADDFTGSPEQLQFAHFDQVTQKIRY